MEKAKVTRIVKYTVLAVIGMLIVGAIIYCVVIGINRGNLPEIIVEHNGQSANITFAGYPAFLGIELDEGSAILPLSDGNYLVGMRLFKDTEDHPFDPDFYPAFFLFDKDWNYVSEVPFDDEGFLSGEEALSMYERMRNKKYDTSDESPLRVRRYAFGTNGLSSKTDGRTDADGRLEDWHTDFGVIRQEIGRFGGEEWCLFKYYYYDFTSHSVKLASVPELDGYLPRSGFIYADGDYDTQLLYGYFANGPDFQNYGHSFAILLKGEEVLWQKSRDLSYDTEAGTYNLESGVTPKAWSSRDKYLVAWPAWTGANDWQFSIVFADGREVAFPPVSLPAEIELDSIQRCNFDEEAVRLDFLFGDDQWISIDHDGNIGKAEPFEIDASHETFDFQFFMSMFSLNDNTDYGNSPGADLYRRRYTTFFARWLELGDYQFIDAYRGACLEVIYNPTETNYVEPKDALYYIFGR